MDVKEEGLIKGDIGAHWYYRAKLSALLRMISDLRPSSVLDVGAGLGFFARSLLAETAITEATCIDPAYRVERCTMVGGKKLWFRPTINSSDAELVLMMDVIEHVADDVGLVAEYVSKVREGTCFVVTVPAFMWLWSGHDVFLEHHRRYTLSGIEQTLCAAGTPGSVRLLFLWRGATVSRGVKACRAATAGKRGAAQPDAPVWSRY